MPRLVDRRDNITVSDTLRLGKGAKLKVVGASGAESIIDLTELGVLDGLTATAAELNILDGVTATAAELNNAVDVSARVQELTATGTVTAGVQSVELNHATVAAVATIADAANHQGLLIVKNTSASGTAAHQLVLTSGTFDGTNGTVTLNAPNECLVVYIDSAGNGTVVENVGAAVLS